DPIIGASVQVKGSTGQGTITDVDGNFGFTAPAGATTLVVSYVGMITQEVPVSANVRVVLVADNEQLEEVVVVGYGTQKKANLTGAVSTVNVSKQLEAR
ncbi:MAG TPA: hypothetical protein DDW85_09405, partial [Porphyromonadaceae bacterium]|nr:hypothetical protein [Porphyromonadaceae bacterium]